MTVLAQNEAPLVPDPSILQNLREQAPLGILEGLRRFIPYQEGFIGSLWQLGYITERFSTLYTLVGGVVFSLLFIALFRRRIENPFQLWVVFLFSLLAVGPVRLQLPLGIESVYGLVRLGGVILGVTLLIKLRDLVRSFLSSSTLVAPLVLYTIALLASYPRVLDPASFVEALKLVLTGYAFFAVGFLSLRRVTELSLYARFFSLVGGVVSIIMLLGFSFQQAYRSVIGAIYPVTSYLKLLFDLDRGRLTPIVDIEILGHFLLRRSVQRRGSVGWLPWLMFVLLGLAVFLSNARYRVLLLVFGVVAFLWLSGRLGLVNRLVLPTIAFVLIYVMLANLVLGVNVFGRFALEDVEADRVPIQVRAAMATDALRMASVFPLTGVGLGNYGEYITFKYRYHGVAFDPYYKLVLDTYRHPHNWYLATLAETGVLGLAALLWLIYRMLAEDRELLIRFSGSARELLLLMMIPTWGFLVGNLLTNLYTSLVLVILFWFLRGILHRVVINQQQRV